MKQNRLKCLKIAMAMLIAALVCAGLSAPVGRVYAGGSANVTLAHIDGLPDGTAFTLNIYKVGSWTHAADGKVVIELDSALAANAKVDPVLVYESEADAEALLESSNNVGNYIKANSKEFTALDTQTVTAADTGGATFSGLADDGLYIVTGDTTTVDKKRWTPKSVYIDILNSDKSMTLNMIKMESAPIVDEYTIVKQWVADAKYEDNEKAARPASVDVEISYGNKLVDTITLSDDNNWSYKWKADESESDKVVYIKTVGDKEETQTVTDFGNDRAWHVTEVADELNVRYQATVTDPSEQLPGTFKIENKFDVTELKITKNLDGYVDAGASSNITVAFRITGKIGDEVVYTNVAGLTFKKGDDLSKTATVTNIPKGLESIEVEEVYAAGYTAKEKVQTKTEADADGTWKFEFDNTHGPGQGSGVVNRYEGGEYVEPGASAQE